jgi:hypothetical protein
MLWVLRMKNIAKKAGKTAFAGRLSSQGEHMVTVAQLAEPDAVNVPVAGSSPVGHPSSL